MTKGNASPRRRLEIEPFRAIHVDIGVFFGIISEFFLGCHGIGVEILKISCAEPKMNKAYEGASCCDEGDAVEEEPS